MSKNDTYNAYTEHLAERIGYLECILDVSAIIRAELNGTADDKVAEALREVANKIEIRNTERRVTHETKKKKLYEAMYSKE